MASIAFERMNQKLENFLRYPGIDQKGLMQRKNNFIATSAIICQVICLTVFVMIVAPKLVILITYGPALLALMFTNIFIDKFARRNMSKYMFINQFILILLTFVNILLLGGIPTSGGLIMVGIAASLMAISGEEIRAAYWLYGTYIITLVLAGILQPWLSVPPAMTTSLNITLYVANTLCLSLFSFIFMINLIKQNIRYEQRETSRLKELDEVKTRLFTNITHEFRTPLTIILGMANLIREKPDEWIREGTDKIRNNGNNLLNLVNQMLDLSKLESGAMPVHIVQEDIISTLRHYTAAFISMATAKHIDLKFVSGTDRFVMDMDHEKLLHIVSNLLSNALKYTPEGGKVELSAGFTGEGKKEFVIRVQDNGSGIEASHLPYIFDRFYRAEENGTQAGHGLGLTLTREFVKLLNGNITVESEPGKGSIFSVTFPVSNQAPFPKIGGQDGKTDFVFDQPPMIENETVLMESSSIQDDRPILLVIEDNPDLVQYLTALLSGEYRINIAWNGKDGLHKALDLIPDIILSDVMMPVMDGITLLDKVKNDMRTSHIPVVMLTAKADIDSKIEGLERGADDYLAKPFNEEELRIRIKKLIELRRKLQLRYASMSMPPSTEDKAIHIEDAFMQKVRQVMEANLDDDQFGIIQLCRSVGMSRAQLYRKFKSLTDKTVNDYLRTFRLHKAKELLLTTDRNVSEVAFDVGFKNLSHFSKVFTEEFGKNPRDMGR